MGRYIFDVDPKRSKLMKRIKSKNTKPELILRRALWELGLRYRVEPRMLGKPDIAFPKKKIAVFVDGEFWHGYKWHIKKDRITSNKTYWINKIERNIERDININRQLSEMGWVVLRFWSTQVYKELTKVTNTIYLIHAST